MARWRDTALNLLAEFTALALVTICVWAVLVWGGVLSVDGKLMLAVGLVWVRYCLRVLLPAGKMQLSSWRERAADDDNTVEV